MILLDAPLVRSAPELASLETLVLVLRASLVALTAAHPCLESDRMRCGALAPCRLARAIHNLIDPLDDAILDYRAAVEDELHAEQQGDPPL